MFIEFAVLTKTQQTCGQENENKIRRRSHNYFQMMFPVRQ